MGGSNAKLTWSSSAPTIYMLCGLQGAGKTTMAAKLAGYLTKSRARNPCWWPATSTAPPPSSSCRWWASRLGVPVFEQGTQDPVQTAQEAVEYAQGTTAATWSSSIPPAGCTSTRSSWMSCSASRDAVKPQEILLVVDAMTGQDAVNVAKTFNDELDIDGVILTKLDGDTRGGAALSRARGDGQAHQVLRRGREAQRHRALPPRPHGQPHPGHGRRADRSSKRLSDSLRRKGRWTSWPTRSRNAELDPGGLTWSRCSPAEEDGRHHAMMLKMLPGVGGNARPGRGDRRGQDGQRPEKALRPSSCSMTPHGAPQSRASSTPAAASAASPRAAAATVQEVNLLHQAV